MTRMEETGVVAQLKEAIRASGRTLGDIGREAGVATSQLSYFLSGQQIVESSCVVDTAHVSCVAATPAFPFSAMDIDLLRVVPSGVATWQQGVASPQVFSAKLGANAQTLLGDGRRPSPVPTRTGNLIFFDTESVTSSSVSTDEVYFIWSCR